MERGDQIPLKAYTDRSAFKLYFLDVGLFRRLAEIDSAVVVQKDAIFDQFNGLIAEQFVLQELTQKWHLMYWTSESEAEVDFVMQNRDKIVPIEVKSGENVRSKSLKVFREKYHSEVAVRFSLKPFEQNEGMVNIPLYEIFATEEVLAK